VSVSYITSNQFLQLLSHAKRRKTISMEKKLSMVFDIKKLWGTCISLVKKIGLSVKNPEYDTQKLPYH
jgi:hypothetical protein